MRLFGSPFPVLVCLVWRRMYVCGASAAVLGAIVRFGDDADARCFRDCAARSCSRPLSERASGRMRALQLQGGAAATLPCPASLSGTARKLPTHVGSAPPPCARAAEASAARVWGGGVWGRRRERRGGAGGPCARQRGGPPPRGAMRALRILGTSVLAVAKVRPGWRGLPRRARALGGHARPSA